MDSILNMASNFLGFKVSEIFLLNWMSNAMILVGVFVAFSLIFAKMKATYGRYAIGNRLPALDARLAWFLQEMPSFFIPLVLMIQAKDLKFAQFIPLAMFITHYFHRTFIYSLLIRGGKKTPVHICFLAFTFCVFNGWLQGRYHSKFIPASDFQLDFQSALKLLGIALFLIGMIINIHSDEILRSLRKPGDTGGYKIPKGGMFEYVSGANFLGEMVEWLGYALFAQSPPAFAFAFFTACNIGPRALHHHQWYLEKFDDYPEDRKALIPYIL